MHVTVSAMGIPASHLLLRNHACAHHGIFVEGQGLIMIDMVFQKRIDGQIQASVSSYICMRLLSFFCFFVTITMDTTCSYMYVLISIEMYIYVYHDQLM